MESPSSSHSHLELHEIIAVLRGPRSLPADVLNARLSLRKLVMTLLESDRMFLSRNNANPAVLEVHNLKKGLRVWLDQNSQTGDEMDLDEDGTGNVDMYLLRGLLEIADFAKFCEDGLEGTCKRPYLVHSTFEPEVHECIYKITLVQLTPQLLYNSVQAFNMWLQSHMNASGFATGDVRCLDPKQQEGVWKAEDVLKEYQDEGETNWNWDDAEMFDAVFRDPSDGSRLGREFLKVFCSAKFIYDACINKSGTKLIKYHFYHPTVRHGSGNDFIKQWKKEASWEFLARVHNKARIHLQTLEHDTHSGNILVEGDLGSHRFLSSAMGRRAQRIYSQWESH